jgi:hypothetical protein
MTYCPGMTGRLTIAILLLAAAGCGRDEVLGPDAPVIPNFDGPQQFDGPPGVDAAPRLCTSAMGTADVTAAGPGGNVTYERLYAGALWEVGPVAPGPGAPMMITVLFTNVDPFDADRWNACQAGDTVNCNTNGLIAGTMSIAAGAEVGDHPVTFTKTDNPAYTVDGTLTITTFVHPFTSSPGQIAGSVDGTMGGRTVSGTFDNEFCVNLLTQTI